MKENKSFLKTGPTKTSLNSHKEKDSKIRSKFSKLKKLQGKLCSTWTKNIWRKY